MTQNKKDFGISFPGQLIKVQTMTDGAWRIYLDIPHSHSAQVLELTKYLECVLQVGVVPIPAAPFEHAFPETLDG